MESTCVALCFQELVMLPESKIDLYVAWSMWSGYGFIFLSMHALLASLSPPFSKSCQDMVSTIFKETDRDLLL